MGQKTENHMASLHTFIRSLAPIILTLVLAACGNDKKQYVIGVSQCSEDIWRDKFNEELMLASYQHDNVTLKILSSNDDNRTQIRQIEQLAEDGVDLLIISPNQLHTITPTVNRVYDRGIPVILFDRKTDGKKYTAFIGADNVEAGRVMGHYIAAQLGGKGNVAEIAGLEGSSPARDRHRGFVQALESYPQIRLVDLQYAGWLEADGARKMDSILARHDDVDFVFAQNDRMAAGASKAAQKAGRNDIRFTGIDALPSAGGGLERVASGELAATYIYPTRGDLVMQLAMNILEGKPFERENYLKSAIVTKENAYVLLMQSEEMSKQQGRLEALRQRVDMYLANYNHQKIISALLVIIVVLLISIAVYIYYTIIARHRMEAEAVQAKLRFFTDVSHELRTPLTLIADPIRQLGKAPNLTSGQTVTLNIANRNVDILLRMVNDILDFRKVQNGKMNMQLSRFDLAKAVLAWTQLFVEAAGQKKITLETKCPAAMPVEADRNKLGSICYNLMSNALKYTPEGGRICVTLTAKDSSAHIEVENTGEGIAEADLTHLFDRFYQARQNVGGTGIGLALVKSFTEMHNGQAVAESNPGEMTRIKVPLPKLTAATGDNDDLAVNTIKPAVSPSAAQTYAAEQLTAVEQEGEKPHLLIIDDNADIREYIHMLTSAYYSVSQASDGAEGLERARKEMPDVIVCDVMMPVMDGLEFCRQLKSDPLICHIPVLLLTARTMAEQQADGYNQGADAYLTKPFNTDVLLARLDNLIRNRQLIKSLFSNPAPTQEQPQRHLSVEEQFVEAFRKVIEDNLGDSDCNADKLAAQMGLSRTQLYRKIKAITGKTANDALREARLRKADYLLKTTHMTASEIAYEVGFSSPSYFSKTYKEAFGHTPRETK